MDKVGDFGWKSLIKATMLFLILTVPFIKIRSVCIPLESLIGLRLLLNLGSLKLLRRRKMLLGFRLEE